MIMAPTNSASSTDKMNYALQVALQTMKERCIQLQRRVSTMEEENQRLREGTHIQTEAGDSLSLRAQLTELQRQKEQLEEHINMVSNENRRLWSRLSQISKDQQLEPTQTQAALKADEATTDMRASQNLIRSKTFTQHSPNPHLRQRMISDEISLEEIALDNFGANDTELGYPYGLQVPVQEPNGVSSTDSDANLDAKRCMDGLQDLRREAMKQQQELSSALTLLESRIALQPCPECAQKAAHKPEMADKSLETDESLNNELKQYNEQHETTQNGHATTPPPVSRLNIIQEKIQADADAMEKTCPMCGKLYSSQISFNAFREHVEMHFIDDSLELENNSIDRQFEFVSHTVGDF